MGVVVLAENKISELALGVDYGQGVELVVPDYIIGFFKRGGVRSGDELFEGSHEGRDLLVAGHAADAVVSARNYADKPAVCRAVLGHGDSGMAVSLLERDNVVESGVGSDVRVADDEARLEILRSCDHCRLVLDALRAEDERYAAFFCERHGELLAGDGLHNGGSQRNVERNRGLLTLFVLDKGRLERHIRGHALARRIAGDEQILIKGMRYFVEIISHFITSDIYRNSARQSFFSERNYYLRTDLLFCRFHQRRFFLRREPSAVRAWLECRRSERRRIPRPRRP